MPYSREQHTTQSEHHFHQSMLNHSAHHRSSMLTDGLIEWSSARVQVAPEPAADRKCRRYSTSWTGVQHRPFLRKLSNERPHHRARLSSWMQGVDGICGSSTSTTTTFHLNHGSFDDF